MRLAGEFDDIVKDRAIENDDFTPTFQSGKAKWHNKEIFIPGVTMDAPDRQPGVMALPPPKWATALKIGRSARNPFNKQGSELINGL